MNPRLLISFFLLLCLQGFGQNYYYYYGNAKRYLTESKEIKAKNISSLEIKYCKGKKVKTVISQRFDKNGFIVSDIQKSKKYYSECNYYPIGGLNYKMIEKSFIHNKPLLTHVTSVEFADSMPSSIVYTTFYKDSTKRMEFYHFLHDKKKRIIGESMSWDEDIINYKILLYDSIKNTRISKVGEDIAEITYFNIWGEIDSIVVFNSTNEIGEKHFYYYDNKGNCVYSIEQWVSPKQKTFYNEKNQYNENNQITENKWFLNGKVHEITKYFYNPDGSINYTEIHSRKDRLKKTKKYFYTYY